ncbi:50S ribosomal protein L23 [Halorhodospira halochloris]|uniref:Large ribosomal subunit protein uL23 n=1 Tax=Halorhodospira halochloris TaxID=1052 RepID=A0A110B6B3_HALHR|nr:50S ribosomal protein L23 [Halorhodospira halochloris]MBK1652811.1 50S ribosomal protein L23 [Halorhodospira halochloris]MCG5530824.1 50S ribosomal protein L23 [Halorhodospira halochloris]MCG5549259.1 50S ribosomal protein L23 [Halorhodospira halochloris]BAU58932.1 LSU ribosomal protein L23p [Halorhodospira halochloris]
MNEERLYTILEGPHISEKSTVIADSAGQVVFRVAIDANKSEIKRAVEKLFEVRVVDVRTARAKGKLKRFGRVNGRRRDWKKAYVTLAEGQDIDFLGAE